jgi:hypothetical protein
MPLPPAQVCAWWSSLAPAKLFAPGTTSRKCEGNHSKEFMQALFKQCGELMLSITQIPQPRHRPAFMALPPLLAASWCRCVIWPLPPMSPNLPFPGINVGLFCSTPAVGLARNLGAQGSTGNAAHR